MTETANLSLPLIAAAQAQKHVTYNEALERLDALVQLGVEDISQTPPQTPAEGQRHICAVGATAGWTGHDNAVAAWQAGAWVFYPPKVGWRAWVTSEAALKVFDGTQWAAAAAAGGGAPGNLQNLPEVGINATADASNRLSVSSPNSLFNHEGSDHRLKINRATAADTASLVFQSDYSGRAELGLAGDDRFRLKVSADGNQWHEALDIDSGSGRVGMTPANMEIWAGGAAIANGHPDEPMIVSFGHAGFSTFAMPVNSVDWRFKIPVFLPCEMAVNTVSFVVKTAGASGARIRIGLRRWDRAAGWSFRELLFETGEVSAETVGRKDAPVGPVTVPAGWYVFDVANNDTAIKLLGQQWNYVGQSPLGSRMVADALRPIMCLYAVQPYSALPADDLGATYISANEWIGNFSIGLW